MAYSLTSGVALTLDEYNAVRTDDWTPPAPNRPPTCSALDAGRRIYKTINAEELSVLFNETGAYFTLNVRDASAMLNLVQARHLAAVLGGTLNDWRAAVAAKP